MTDTLQWCTVDVVGLDRAEGRLKHTGAPTCSCTVRSSYWAMLRRLFKERWLCWRAQNLEFPTA